MQRHYMNNNNNNITDKKKKASYPVDSAIPVDQRVKIKERKKDIQILGPCQRTNDINNDNNVEHEGDNELSLAYLEWSPKV